MAPVITKPALLAVSTSLREARERQGLGVRELARQLGVSPSRVSNWELGTHEPKPTVAARLLGSLQVGGSEFDQILEISEHLSDRNFIDQSSSRLVNLLWAYEKLASRIVEWAPFAIPDLLQTPTCGDAVVDIPLTRSDRLEQERFHRQFRHETLDEGTRQYVFMIGEQALDNLRNDPNAARQQIAHLRASEKLKHITIRVAPTTVRASRSMSPFTLFELGAGAFAVALRHNYCTSYLTDAVLVGGYSDTARALQRQGIKDFMTVEQWSDSVERQAS
ncbi:Scr1 family TA system antitoxin-like transcriptional regulator [Amycolatopsis sp. NPDC051758]|uniref:Scr1 family TA system antitoxin-like transcriptional regulator n=1 Tax=Amycolatopsis sp. NPDC051758 TaxID=3363935 RepID=UPI00378AD446